MGRYDIALKKLPEDLSGKDKLSEKVWLRLNHYLGFDIDAELLSGNDSIVFGGAVRDSLAEQPIHDVDMLVLPVSVLGFEEKLHRHGFKRMFSSASAISSYLGTSRGVQEPHTFFKDDSIIQIVQPTRPVLAVLEKPALFAWLENSDISACGVAYDGKVHEVVHHAVADCCSKMFSVNIRAPLYQPDRAAVRIKKLVDRGWTQVERPQPSPPPEFQDRHDITIDRRGLVKRIAGLMGRER
jgi:hypothetical protein